MGNSSYGKKITDKSKHINITYCDNQTVNEGINSKLVAQMNEILITCMKQRLHRTCQTRSPNLNWLFCVWLCEIDDA